MKAKRINNWASGDTSVGKLSLITRNHVKKTKTNKQTNPTVWWCTLEIPVAGGREVPRLLASILAYSVSSPRDAVSTNQGG